MSIKTSVPVGITSVIGWLSALGGLLPVIVQSIEEGAVAFNSSNKWMAIAGVVFGAITQVGRYLQAHAQIKADSAERIASGATKA
jgi:hypothetical protein